MVQISGRAKPLYVGVPGRIEIELVARKAMKISQVRARVVGRHGWSMGQTVVTDRSEAANSAFDHYADVRLMEAGMLPEGTTRLAFEVAVPDGAPPTHLIAPAWARADVVVQVARPWWFDTIVSLPLVVRHRSPPIGPALAAAARSVVQRSDAPRIELGVSASVIAAGETLVGSVAVFHMTDREPREVSVAFVPRFVLYGRGGPHLGSPLTMTVTIPAGGTGTSVPFALQAPWEMPPNFTCSTHGLAWNVVARTGGLFSGTVSVSVPILVVDQSAGHRSSTPAIPPGLTDDRVAGAFANFARFHDWRMATDPHTDAWVRTIAKTIAGGSAELQLAYTHRPDGTFLIARVAHASLGLGLEITPTSSLGHMFRKDIDVGNADWDRRHVVHARFAEQAIPVVRAVVPALEAPTPLGSLVRWTDRELAYERLVIAVGPPELAVAAQHLERLATAILEARELATPPPGCQVDIAAWRALATAIGGQLALGDLSIADAGTGRRMPVHVGLEFDDESPPRPTAVRATLGEPTPGAADAPALVAELIADWPADLVFASIVDGVASAVWRVPPTCAIDAARVRELVDRLRALLAALSPDGGPYR